MESAHQALLQQVASLSESSPQLGRRLSQAAQALEESGIPPAESLLEEVVTYSRNFSSVKLQAIELSKSLPSTPAIASIQDIQELVKQVSASPGSESTRQQALQTIDRALAIAHRDLSDFPPLQSVHEQARQLRRTIADATTLPPDAEALATGKHPIAAVVTLVEQADSLSDEQWVVLEEKVGEVFGKQLALALSRGKLIAFALPETAKPEPAKPVAVSQPTHEPISEVIVIPSNRPTPPKTIAVDPDIEILESPPPAAPMHEVIIVPSVEVAKKGPQVPGPHIVFGDAAPTVSAEGSVGLKVLVHIQGIGDRTFAGQEYAGTRGQGRRVEGFQLNLEPPIPGLGLQYMAHVEGVGDTAWVNEGELAGFRGKAKRIEGFAIRLTGPEAENYDVFYTGHVQNVGDTPVASNGQYCGTRSKSLRVEGIKVWVQRSAKAIAVQPLPTASVGLKVLAHIQGIGDRTFAAQEYAGTRGQGRRVEAFQLNIEPPVPGLSVQYMAHVEGIGDTAWLSEGELAGVRGQAKRIEGFAMRLAGPEAAQYDIFYTAHVQNVGDTPVASNGQYCGTRGKSLRVEGIKVWIEPKS